MCNEKEILEENVDNEDYEVEEEISEIQQAFDEVSFAEELKRIDKQDSKLEIPKAISEDKVFKTISAQAYGIANGFKALIEAGMSYNDAVAIVNNISVGHDNEKTAKAQGIQMQQQMA